MSLQENQRYYHDKKFFRRLWDMLRRGDSRLETRHPFPHPQNIASQSQLPFDLPPQNRKTDSQWME